MAKDTKIILGVIVATIVIVVGGIFLTTKNQNNPAATANPSLLISSSSIIETAPNEKAVLVEFGDLQCPACGAYHPLITQARGEFKDNLTYVFRNFPLTQHKNAKVAAYALEAAGVQDKYWEMQDKLYTTQAEWSDLSNPTETFVKYATEFGLDKAKFTASMNDPVVKKKVEDDLADGNLLKVNSTPTFYLNGTIISPATYEELKSLIESHLN